MIKIFRKIRHSFLLEGKTTKYYKYAIGEIILVVIGILIALQINNWNEGRKTNEKTELLLKQVHKELAFNIKKANDVIEFYRRKDTMIYKVLSKKVTYDNYKSNRKYVALLLGTEEVNIAIDDYINLMENQNQFNQNQDSIISNLKELYRTDKNNVDILDKNCLENFLERGEKLKNEKVWYYNYHVLNENTEDMIQYFLTDPYYLNEVTRYQQRNLGDHLKYTLIFRNKAINIYNELSDYLNVIKDTSIVKNLKDYEHYIGTYISKDNKYKNEIKKQDDHLILKWENMQDSTRFGEINFYPDSKTNFTFGINSFGKLIFDENNKVLGFDRTKGTIIRREYKKVE